MRKSQNRVVRKFFARKIPREKLDVSSYVGRGRGFTFTETRNLVAVAVAAAAVRALAIESNADTYGKYLSGFLFVRATGIPSRREY